LTARWLILRLAWVSSTPLLSLRCAETVTYRILKECRYCFFKPISRKDNGGSSCQSSKIGNGSFPESRNVSMSHCLWLLPFTGNYMSELITLIILTSSARQRCGYIGGDEKGSLKSETVKYSYLSQGAWTRERLSWRRAAAYIKHRPDLSSESWLVVLDGFSKFLRMYPVRKITSSVVVKCLVGKY
jgi:hypothetical protein